MSGRIAVLLLCVAAPLCAATAGCSRGPSAQAAEPVADVTSEVVAEAVRRNGPSFVDWPKPRFALVFTGDLNGYIEPCGCAGLDNLKGGLSRRHTLLESLRKQDWSVAAFDLGGLVRRVGVVQTEIKLQATVKGLIAMDFTAVGFGADDLRMPAATLLGAALEPYNDRTLPLTSANVALFGFDSGATVRYRTVKVNDVKIGVTAVLGDSYAKTIVNEGVTVLPAEQALAEVVRQLAAEQCDGHILLSYATPEESAAFAKKFPEFQYVVTAGGGDEPPATLKIVEGAQAGMVEVGHKGQYAAVVAFFDDPQTPVRYQRVPLDARFPESPAMKQLLAEYQDQLRIAGFTNLGVTERIHPRTDPANPALGQFVGSQACADCHPGAYEVWKDSGHAHATDTLVKLNPQRHFDPECLSCHATGWDPQQYVPFQTGFLGLNAEGASHLTGNGCENCHGPGGAHVAAENGNDGALQARLRLLMHVGLENVERTTCIKCHDHDNSPEFSFESYWPQIEH
jgi:hypothetical protein